MPIAGTETQTIPHLEILLSAARPDLFRSNAFRIMGLPVDATARDIAKQAEKQRMAAKFGGVSASASPLALSPPPDDEMIRAAVDRLRDPERRLVDEFFWFWPHQLGDGGRDPALAVLAAGRTQEAMNLWTHQENHNSISNVSMHNLAVLAHATVLDIETQARDKVDATVLGQYWSAAFLRWKALIADESFWSRLTARIRDLGDPRLTTGTARRMRNSLPLALLAINAQLAVRAAEAGNPPEVQRHLDVMRASGLGEEAIRGGLARAVEPIRDRVKTLCHTGDNEAEADPARANLLAERLLAQAAPLLALLDLLLPERDAVRDGAHDEVALRVLKYLIAYGNKTDDMRTVERLYEQVLPLAGSAAAKGRIEENLRIVRSNLQLTSCFFCGEHDGTDTDSIKFKMYNNIRVTSYGNSIRKTWTERPVKVPRCPRCRKGHGYFSGVVPVCVLGGLAAAGIVAGMLFPSSGDSHGWYDLITRATGDEGWAVLGVIILIACWGFACGWGSYWIAKTGRYKAVRSIADRWKFPLIEDLKRQGWQTTL